MREIVLDTETTGFDPETGDRIVEIGAVELKGHMPTGNTYHQYINPERAMPEEAFQVHGLGDDFLHVAQEWGRALIMEHDLPEGDKSLQPAIYYVEQNFREKITADNVASLCGMSSFRFSRNFKNTYGIAFRDYVVRYRLREAYHMLETGHTSVTEAAYACGFNDVGYFSRVFKRYFNTSPSEMCKGRKPLEEDDSPTMALRIPTHH